MKEVDYIIVGLGIGGISFCEQLLKHDKTFLVFDNNTNTATQVAGGVINPIVLKRFRPIWNALEFINKATVFYKELSGKLDISILENKNIYRIFDSIEEQNNWITASDTVKLFPYLNSEIVKNENSSVIAAYALGKLKSTLKINTHLLLKKYRNYLEYNDYLIPEKFNYSDVEFKQGSVVYGNINSKKIVFAEGVNAINNPFLPIDCITPMKGEYLVIKSPQLLLQDILKSTFFIIPLGNHLYKIGATFAHNDPSYKITEDGRDQLLSVTKKVINCPFEVIDQEFGIRPTVKDRRPVLGSIENEQVIFFNGLGTHGLLMAPLLANYLYNFSENNISLPEEIDIKRFL